MATELSGGAGSFQIRRALTWLRAAAKRMANDSDVADDLAQDTVIAAVRCGRVGDGELDRRWMAHVLRNGMRARLRAERRRTAREASVCAGQPAVSEPCDELSLSQQQAGTLWTAVAQLREPFTTTVRLRYVEDEELISIARRLGVPPATVRRRHQLALGKLRRALSPLR